MDRFLNKDDKTSLYGRINISLEPTLVRVTGLACRKHRHPAAYRVG
jgi:hypothetical protein